jgi:hypothetical protein
MNAYLTGLHYNYLLMSSSQVTEMPSLKMVEISQVSNVISMATRPNLCWEQVIAP